MKLHRDNFVRRNEHGSTVVFFIALLAIMMILVGTNSRSLFHLHREIKLLEQQQIKRLDASQTNTVAIAQSGTNPESR
jgi:hypothetical protein